MSALVVAASFGIWFFGRARIGLRARRAAGARLRPIDRIVSNISMASVRATAAGGLVGAWFGGSVMVPVGLTGGWLWWLVVASNGRRRQRARLDAQVPEAMRAIAAAMRAGGSLHLALTAVGEELPEPMGPLISEVAARCSLGAHLDEALGRFGEQAATDACSGLVETLRVGAAAGASLPNILDVAANAQDEWARLDRDRAAATSQVRLSAAVVGLMPLAFLGLAGPAARGPARMLVREPEGWVLLAVGLGLDALGWVWMRRLGAGMAR